jgi:hypothetical protein
MNATKIRKARKEHRCTEKSYHTIKAGDLYLSCVMVPWHDMNQSGKYQTIRACLRCANEFGMHTSETRAAVEGKAVSK